MAATNAADHYGAVTKTLHWATALGIIANLALGLAAVWVPTDPGSALTVKTTLFSIHKTLGVTLFFLALARILWALTQPKPAPLHPERPAETLAAETVHWLLYGSLVAVPLAGWIGHAASEGFAPIWWPLGQGLPLVPASPALAEGAWAVHVVLVWVLAGSIALHVAGALKHHLVDGDATLRRMLPGRTRAGGTAGRPGHALPAGLAVLVWAAAFGTGAALGTFRSDAAAPPAPALEAVASDWQVQDGTLAIAVTQMNDEVTGTFNDWTADITFEDRDSPGRAGSVTVEIAVGSLTIGSVTKQATGPDFLAAEAHPRATFAADILRTEDGWVAEGTLSLKGSEVRVQLPFDLELEDDTARMSGSTTLDRLAYDVGTGTSESQVGRNVRVDVSLTAERAAGD
ncbi:cytochrome b/b6 domain-containing protein [Roseivivax sediminis]|uniref:Cytochrome b561 n=1 Tax=Roseivivax sediminis TaxID=936889 RepID=A0A1I1Y3D3_9RHOB|nr:cytochrome b/b6 domain-containing protein [Roseivivax sediminis]SFE14225.1 Cytochrome b561 [Roseivivax sediminis]